MSRISVIIPAYNCAPYLASAIESVLAQTFRDVEIVVVNDGSTDDTAAVAAKFGAKIKLISTANQGPAAARNCGIRASSSEYIAFLDADDWWEIDKLQSQLAMIADQPEVGLVYSDMVVHRNDGSVLDSFLRTRKASSGYVFDQLIDSQFIFTSTVLVRRAALDAVGLFDESMRSLEDCDLLLRLCQRWKVALVPKPLLHRRSRSGNLTSDVGLASVYAVRFQAKALQLPGLTVAQRRKLAAKLSEAHTKRARYLLEHGQRSESRSHVFSALKHDARNTAALRCLGASLLPTGALRRVRAWRGLPQDWHRVESYPADGSRTW